MPNNAIWRDLSTTLRRRDRMVHQLIILNVAVFLVINLVKLFYFLFNLPLDPDFPANQLAIPSNWNTLLHQPWTVITFMFMHIELLHILFNMLWFYWFGMILTEFLGNRKILPLYIMGGLAGALFFILAYQLFPVFGSVSGSARAYGASASVLAIVAAAATLVPNYTIYLFIFGPVKIKWIAIITIALDLISIPTENAGGHLAHLGGALFGFVYIKELQRGRDWTNWLNKSFDAVVNWTKGRPAMKVSYKTNRSSQSAERKVTAELKSKQERIDTILDKIAASGYESLTGEEKTFLFHLRDETDK